MANMTVGAKEKTTMALRLYPNKPAHQRQLGTVGQQNKPRQPFTMGGHQKRKSAT